MKKTNRWVVVGAASVALVAACLLGATFAPTTEHLIIQAVGHEGLADDGNKLEATLVVAIYNAAGPITRMAGGSFSVQTVATPAGGYAVKKASVVEVGSGVYQIKITPDTEDRNAVWKRGRYVLAVTLTSPNGSGTALGQLSVDL